VIRDAKTNKPIVAIPADEETDGIVVEVACATFSPDATRFAASMIDSGLHMQKEGEVPKSELFQPTLSVWDANSGKPIWKGEGGSAKLGVPTFAPDGKSLGFGRGRVVVTTMGESAHLAMNPGHTGNVLAVAFGAGGLLWSAGEDRLIRGHYHSLPPRDEQFVLRGCSKGVVRLAVSPDGKELAAALGEELGTPGAIYRFDIAALNTDSWRAANGRHQASFVTGLSPDGARFAACELAVDRKDLVAGRLVTRAMAGGPVRELKSVGVHLHSAFRPDGSLLVIDRDNLVHLIDPNGKQTAEFKMTMEHFSIAPPLVAYIPNGQTVAMMSATRSNGGDKPKPDNRVLTARLIMRDLVAKQTGLTTDIDLSTEFPSDAQAMIFPSGITIDQSGTRMATTFLAGWQVAGRARLELRGVLVVLDLKAGKELFRRITQKPLYSVVFGPRGNVVAAGGDASGGEATIWDLKTGQSKSLVVGHSRANLSLAFSPDGRLATGGADHVVKLWDTASGREILTLDGFAREVTHLTFTSDGTGLVAGTGLELLSMLRVVGIPTDWPPAEVRVFRRSK
jgi:WD40 repeat protein